MAVDQIGTKALVDCSVAAADIAPGTITSAKLAGSIANAKLSNSSITVNGTSIALGASGAVPDVQWQSVVVSDGSTVTTMVAGRGYFVNNTSAAGIVKLPASASIGDTVVIKDYAGNFGTNNLTIQRNSDKIQGNTNDSTISTNRAVVALVYVDATKGWLYTIESAVSDFGPQYVAATGGIVATSGDFKIHTFTGDANFVVSDGGNSLGSNSVSYLVIAGGGGGTNQGGGGGAGGFREGKHPSTPYTSSPLVAPTGLPVSAQTYPITVGGGGAGAASPNSYAASAASNSVFSTITSAGGGKGGCKSSGPDTHHQGGSGGGGAGTYAPVSSPSDVKAGGVGNYPPVSPAQGNAGGNGSGPQPSYVAASGGGGGAGAAGSNAGPVTQAGAGGAGASTEISGSAVVRASGGGGGANKTDGVGGPAHPGGGVT